MLADEEIVYIKEALKLFSKVEIGLKKHTKGIQNISYEYSDGNQTYILRLSHEKTRTLQALKGEIDFLLFLSNNEVEVSGPITSIKGNYIETLKVKETLYYDSLNSLETL